MKVDIEHRGWFDQSQIAVTLHEQGVLAKCLEMSQDWWTGRADGELACVWGVIPGSAIANSGYLWLQVTPLVRQHRVAFSRWGLRVIETMLCLYDEVYGHVGPFDCAPRFLRFLGAEIGPLDHGLPTFKIGRHSWRRQ
jgi:hypothetical protein